MSDEASSWLEHLKVLGQSQGFLTYAQVNERLPLAVLPLMIFTGLAMSPTIAAAYPILRDVFGETQSLRTIHFFVFVVLILFLVVHVLMVIMSGFKRQLRAMTFGN